MTIRPLSPSAGGDPPMVNHIPPKPAGGIRQAPMGLDPGMTGDAGVSRSAGWYKSDFGYADGPIEPDHDGIEGSVPED